jgi:hypothetical protein
MVKRHGRLGSISPELDRKLFYDSCAAGSPDAVFQNSRGGEAWSSAIGAEQQSSGQGREAAVALGHDAEAKSPARAAQARKTCAALAGLGSHPSFLGLTPQAPLHRAFSAHAAKF